MSVHMKTPIFRDADDDVVKNVVIMVTISLTKCQVESIYRAFTVQDILGRGLIDLPKR